MEVKREVETNMVSVGYVAVIGLRSWRWITWGGERVFEVRRIRPFREGLPDTKREGQRR